MNRRAFLKTTGAAAALSAVPAVVRAQGKEVKLGYILPVTGPLAFEAQLSLNGLQLAVDEVNAAGGVKALGGAKLALLPGDTQQKVELGNSEAARLIDAGVSALIGPFSSLVAFLGAAGDREEQDAVHAAGRRRRTTSPRAGSSTSSACSRTARPCPP
jgi:branched-chain amino acid transport system substrate-binding protein